MDSRHLGRYEIISELGHGGMGTVYHARDPRFQRNVAIKVLPREFMHDPQFSARFDREAQTIAALEHPNILPVYDFGDQDGQPFLVMRSLSGGSLADKLKKGPLNIDEVTEVLQRIGSALDYAHSNGVIHRDLKPGNILFDDSGRAFLTDFGIAQITEATALLTGTSAILGTPAYMSPEQLHGDRDLDGRSDIYSMGVTLFEMLTGKQPYSADTPTKVMMKHLLDPVPNVIDFNPDIPKGFQSVISQAMAKEPGDRYSTAIDLADDVQRLIAGDATNQQDDSSTIVESEMILGETFIESPSPVIEPTDKRRSTQAEPTHATPIAREVQIERRRIPKWLLFVSGIFILGIAIIIGVNVVGSRSAVPEENTQTPPTIEASTEEAPTSLPTEDRKKPTITPEATVLPTDDTTNGIFLDSYEVPMVLVPAGAFIMGSDEGTSKESPTHTVTLDDFYIDQYEVTNARYAQCVAEFVCPPPTNSASFTHQHYYGNIEFKDYPVVNVTWENAVAYCEWRGARLPTEAEWEKAARGQEGLRYPWGDDFDASKLNFCDASCPSDNANTEFTDGYADTSPSGSFPDGLSPYNVYDMAGNVWEWVMDWYAEDYYESSPEDNPTGPSSGEERVARGGSWFYGEGFAQTTFRHRYKPLNYYHFLGFRCVRDTVP